MVTTAGPWAIAMKTQSIDSQPKRGHVEPLHKGSDIEKIRNLLAEQPRNALFFELALATDLKAKQLLNMKVGELAEWVDRGTPLPQMVKTAFGRYVDRCQPLMEDYVFKSQKGGAPLSLSSASRMVGSWYARAGIKGLSGFLSLKKAGTAQNSSPPDMPTAIPREPFPPAIAQKPMDRPFGPIQVPTINETVYRKLERAIVSGQFLPGTKLNADLLASQMKVSTIPVREALARLEVRGLVTIIPQKGAIVIVQSEKSIKEILEIRMILESAAVEKVFPKLNADTVQLLEQSNTAYAHAWRDGNVAEILSSAKQFHDRLYRDLQMPNLIKMIDQIWDVISPYYHLMFKNMGVDIHSGADYHSKIIEAVRKREKSKVLYWLKMDLSHASEHVADTLKWINLER